MAHVLLHLTAVERLAAEPHALPTPLVRALQEDLAYARFGAVLLRLPEFDGWSESALRAWARPGESHEVKGAFRVEHPVMFGLKMAELVGLGALVGVEPGLAFVSGYFTHLSLERSLAPLEASLISNLREEGEPEGAARARLEALQAAFYLRDLHGRDVLGTRFLRSKFQVLKREGLPTRGVGLGLYELVRLAAQETQHLALRKSQLDGWVRRLYLYGYLLGGPLGRRQGLRAASEAIERQVYRGAAFDLWSQMDDALAEARRVLSRLYAFIHSGRFTPRTRERFLEGFPERDNAPSEVRPLLRVVSPPPPSPPGRPTSG